MYTSNTFETYEKSNTAIFQKRELEFMVISSISHGNPSIYNLFLIIETNYFFHNKFVTTKKSPIVS